MQDDGVDVTMEDVAALCIPGASIGRPHFADYLVAHNRAKSRTEAFDKYLGIGRPWYVPLQGTELSEGLAAIRASGALPVLAHPFSLYLSWGSLPALFAGFRDQGLAGIEAWHPSARPADGSRLEKLAADLGLLVSAGSDFHGSPTEAPPKRRRDKHRSSHVECTIGHTSGGREITADLVSDALLSHVASLD
jgi:hypothetical protein